MDNDTNGDDNDKLIWFPKWLFAFPFIEINSTFVIHTTAAVLN